MYGYRLMTQRRNRRSFKERTGFPLKLLQPGYSGDLDSDELAVLVVELKRSSKLRKRWGLKDNEKITIKRIQELALGESEGNGQD